MSEDRKYNGWANYETWNVALWMGNEQGSSEYWCERAEDCVKRAKGGDGNPYADNTRDRASMLLADELKDWHEEVMHDMLDEAKQSASMWSDLLGAALSEVDWREIADHHVDDVEIEEETA